MSLSSVVPDPDGLDDNLLGLIYGTLVDDGQWRPVLDRLCVLTGSRWAALASYDFRQGVGQVIHQVPPEAPLGTIYALRPGANPLVPSRAEYVPGRVFTGLEIIGAADFVKTDFYQEVLRPHAIFHRLCGVLRRSPNEAWFVVLHRHKGQPGFDVSDKQCLAGLLGHLSRVFEIRMQLQGARHRVGLLAQAARAHLSSFMIVDASCRVVFASPGALDQIGGQGVADSWRGHADDPDWQAVREAVHALARSDGEAGGGAACRVLQARRRDGEGEVRLSLRSIGKVEDGGGALVSIAVSDPRSEARRAVHSFAEKFALSPAQTRVSELILQGMSPSAAARALHISENTVRSHLKQIFLKTNTHRQAELVNLHGKHLHA